MTKWHAAVCSILIWMMPAPMTNFRTQEMSLIPPKFEPTPKSVTAKVDIAKMSASKVDIAKVNSTKVDIANVSASKVNIAKVSAAKVSAPKMVPNSVSAFFGQLKETERPPGLAAVYATTTVSTTTVGDIQFLMKSTKPRKLSRTYADDQRPPSRPGSVKLAGLPRELNAFPLRMGDSYDLQLNVSWVPSTGFPATSYSIEVENLNKSEYCREGTGICYRYNILQNDTWALIPEMPDTKDDACVIRPGCSYLVKLMAYPGDGHSTTNLMVPLKECEAEICSCAHWRHLPVPEVSAQTFFEPENGTYKTNITWVLPAPSRLRRLPLMLGKKSYIVQIKKQVPVKHKDPWYDVIPNNTWLFKAEGLVLEGDTIHLKKTNITQEMIMLKAKLIAVVKLVDERNCVGYAGNATVYDPEEIQKNKQKAPLNNAKSESNLSFGIYAILGALIGAWAMGAVFVLSARFVKRVLKSLRPAPVSAPLEPLRRRPAWFPLQLRT